MKFEDKAMQALLNENKALKKAIKTRDKKIKTRDKEFKAQQKVIKTFENMLQHENGLWSVSDKHQHANSDDVARLHKLEALYHDIKDPKALFNATKRTCDQFEYLLELFKKESKSFPDAPLFSEDNYADPGNRCILDYQNVLFMALMRKRHGTKQEILAMIFSVDQSTVSRYIDFANKILPKILPTAHVVTRRIEQILKDIEQSPNKKEKAANQKKLEELIPGRKLMIDGTHNPIQRPTDKELRKDYYSGKKKKFTVNTMIITNKKGFILGISKSVKGSTHDLTLLRNDPPKFFEALKMYDSKTPNDEKVTVGVDRGYQRIVDDMPGARIKIPHKKPKGGELIQKQKDYNYKINSKRVVIEHSIGEAKQYKLMSYPFDGTDEEFDVELNIVTGLVNFDRLWDPGKKKLKYGF